MRSLTPLKNRAIDMRRKGMSYSQILKELGLASKGTLSVWFKDIELSDAEKSRLQANTNLAVKRGLFSFNEKRTSRIAEENEAERLAGSRLVGNLSSREMMLIGAALYWGEGTKSEARTKSPPVVFTNSDPLMAASFMRFVRSVLKADEGRIRAGIHLYASTDENEARRFWSKTTGLPQDRFYIVRQVSGASKGRRPSNILPFGTVVIKVHNRHMFHHIKGMIAGIAGAMK